MSEQHHFFKKRRNIKKDLHRIVRNEMKKSGGEAKVTKVPDKCRLTQEGLEELKEEIAGMRTNDGTLYGALDYNKSRRYWCRGISAGITPSVNSEKTQSGTEEKADDRDR